MADAVMLPEFSLKDLLGAERKFPSGRNALLCFVKEDCPTCRLTMPLIEAAHEAFGAKMNVFAVGQDAEGNAKLVSDFQMRAPMLDDSALAVSFSYDLDTVPTIILAAADGSEIRRFVGFDKPDWQAMMAELAKLSGDEEPRIDWAKYPQQRPGCGSKSVEPEIAERLEAEARGEHLTARQIEIGDQDPFEFMFERGLTDGLPVIPPTRERVLRMLTGTRRDPREVIANLAPNMGPATIEKIAANAVMAGCKPEYLPVVIAAIEAVAAPEFNAHGIMSTTWGATPVIVVNGPIRERIGMNMGIMALGYGHRANATIGRAVKLTLRNVGGAKP
ncbi:MAG TPA: redoxin domain-containing protein, partial [Candidatus Binataceae bacterium]|nr:redoxin domain-containing protein [Candidatus Binataceae bacterium]